jgi:hypothetical protein
MELIMEHHSTIMSLLETRLFILIKRARIVLDVLEFKKSTHLIEFVEKTNNVIESIIDYAQSEKLTDDLLNYCYDGLTCVEKIMNFIDILHFRIILHDKSAPHFYSEFITMLDELNEKFQIIEY